MSSTECVPSGEVLKRVGENRTLTGTTSGYSKGRYCGKIMRYGWSSANLQTSFKLVTIQIEGMIDGHSRRGRSRTGIYGQSKRTKKVCGDVATVYGKDEITRTETDVYKRQEQHYVSGVQHLNSTLYCWTW